MIKTSIRFFYYALFLLVPLVMSSQTSELFEFNKMLVIYAITVSVVCLWITHILVHGAKIVFYPLITVPFLVFLLSQFVSTAFSIDLHTSLFGYYGRFNGGLVSIISYFLLFFVFFQVFEKKHVPKLLIVSMIASCIVVLWGLPGWFGHDLSCLVFTGEWTNTCWTHNFRPSERMFSTLGQPNWLGAYLVIHLCMGIWGVFQRFFISVSQKSQKVSQHAVSVFDSWQLVSFGYVFLMFVGVVATRSRSALLAAAVCVLAFSIFLFLKFKKGKQDFVHNPLIQTGAILMGGCIIILLFIKTGIPRVDTYLSLETIAPSDEASSLGKEENQEQEKTSSPELKQEVSDSFDIRRIVWEGAWKLGMQYPLFGTGVETFAYAYYFTRPVAHNMTSEWDFIYNKAHNEFLNYLATTGFVGLASYLLFIGSVFVAAWFILRKSSFSFYDRFFIFTCIIAYFSILITNFFGFSVTSINIFFSILPAGIGIYLPESYKKQHKDISPAHSFVSTIGILILGGIGVYFLYAIYQYRAADILYARAQTFIGAQSYDKAVEYLEEALARRYEHVYEDKMSHVLAQYSLLTGFENEEGQKTTHTFIEYSEMYNASSLQAAPQNVLYWKTKGRNAYLYYYATNDVSYLSDGEESLDVARKLAPTDPQILHSEALLYSAFASAYEDDTEKKKRYEEKSIRTLDDAIALKQNFRDAHVLKGQLLAQYGEVDKAREVFEFVLEHIEPRDTEVREELEKL